MGGGGAEAADEAGAAREGEGDGEGDGSEDTTDTDDDEGTEQFDITIPPSHSVSCIHSRFLPKFQTRIPLDLTQ